MQRCQRLSNSENNSSLEYQLNYDDINNDHPLWLYTKTYTIPIN